jgi:type I restriction enzyme S subunit
MNKLNKNPNRLKNNISIPEGWIKLKVKDIITNIRHGYALKSRDYREAGMPVIRISNITLDGKFNYEEPTSKFCSEEISKNKSYCILKKGDMIIAMTDVMDSKPLIGRTAIINMDMMFFMNQRVGLIELDETRVDKYFLNYFFNWDVFRKKFVKLIGQSAQANISFADIKRSTIIIPKSIKEQRKITTIISQIDEKISSLEKLLHNVKDMKDKFIDKLLIKGISHNEYKKSIAGKIPINWKIAKLGDFVRVIKNGTSINEKNISEKGYNVIHKKHIKKGGRLKLKKSRTVVNEGHVKRRPNSLVGKGYLALTTRDLCKDAPSIGLMMVIDDDREFVLAQGTSGIKLSDSLDNHYLALLSNTTFYRSIIKRIAVGSTQQHIRIKDLLNMEIPIPPMKEQQKIANILYTIHEKILILKKKRRKYKKLKKQIMFKLLAGEIRVNT